MKLNQTMTVFIGRVSIAVLTSFFARLSFRDAVDPALNRSSPVAGPSDGRLQLSATPVMPLRTSKPHAPLRHRRLISDRLTWLKKSGARQKLSATSVRHTTGPAKPLSSTGSNARRKAREMSPSNATSKPASRCAGCRGTRPHNIASCLLKATAKRPPKRRPLARGLRSARATSAGAHAHC